MHLVHFSLGSQIFWKKQWKSWATALGKSTLPHASIGMCDLWQHPHTLGQQRLICGRKTRRRNLSDNKDKGLTGSHQRYWDLLCAGCYSSAGLEEPSVQKDVGKPENLDLTPRKHLWEQLVS